MKSGATGKRALDPSTRQFYCRSVEILNESKVPYLVGGAYALARYTGIERHTKDFDIFVRKQDCQRVLELFSEAGYQTDLTYPHWLGKAFSGNDYIDVIFSSGNGVAVVDDHWFNHAVECEVLGLPARICPAEEMIWSKSFIMERERFDGADIAHLLYACGHKLDWPRLFGRFQNHWHVLLSHLILFKYIYPAERDRIPSLVMLELMNRLRKETRTTPPPDKVCRGTLLSREQYLFDVDELGYEDARQSPRGNMTREQIAHWTAAIEDH